MRDNERETKEERIMKKRRTLQYKTINMDGSVIGHAVRFPLCDTYKAIYCALRDKGQCYEVRIYTWEEK